MSIESRNHIEFLLIEDRFTDQSPFEHEHRCTEQEEMPLRPFAKTCAITQRKRHRERQQSSEPQPPFPLGGSSVVRQSRANGR